MLVSWFVKYFWSTKWVLVGVRWLNVYFSTSHNNPLTSIYSTLKDQYLNQNFTSLNFLITIILSLFSHSSSHLNIENDFDKNLELGLCKENGKILWEYCVLFSGEWFWKVLLDGYSTKKKVTRILDIKTACSTF